MTSEDTPAPFAFFRLATSYQITQALSVAAKLGIADQLADGPKTLDELAHAIGANAATLRLLMRALSTIDIFAETSEGRFMLTPLASYLRSDTPYSQRGWAISQAQITYRAWAELLHTVTSGQPAFEHVFGTNYYDYMAQHPEAAAEWDRSMDQTARDWLGALATSYDFAPIQTIVDVGGGHGAALADILKHIPTMRGILFDLPHVVAGAGPLLAEAGVAERCEVIGGDMFAEVPSGGDAYLISRVLFNWDDQHARALLQSCRRAMTPHAKLLVIDVVDSDADKPKAAAFGDLNLLLLFGGRQRTESEFHALFASAGFAITRILPTQSHFKLVEARLLE
ncbi:MAG: methyltransferase [Roseiflexaceae bacterium]